MASPTRQSIASNNQENRQTNGPKLLASPIIGSPRRILGDISTNSRNASPVSSHKHVLDRQSKTPHGSPVKAQNPFTPAALLAYKDLAGYSPFVSTKKRSFAAMDERHEETEANERKHIQRSPLRQAQTISPANARRVADSTPNTHPSSSQAEHSETDDEDLHLNVPEAMEESVRHKSQGGGGGSFSSLIDYDPAEASDKSASASVSPAASRSTNALGSQEHTPEKPLTRTETIRTRLRMAMFRVNTDQVYVPIADLKLPIVNQTKSFLASLQAARPTTAASLSSHVDPAIARSTQSSRPPAATFGKAPSLLPPAPFLQPSSSAPTSHKISYKVTPSSPPGSAVTDKPSLNGTRGGPSSTTPAGSKRFHEIFVVNGITADTPVKVTHSVADHLTSSAVKGSAATGLLELSRGG